MFCLCFNHHSVSMLLLVALHISILLLRLHPPPLCLILPLQVQYFSWLLVRHNQGVVRVVPAQRPFQEVRIQKLQLWNLYALVIPAQEKEKVSSWKSREREERREKGEDRNCRSLSQQNKIEMESTYFLFFVLITIFLSEWSTLIS